MCVGEIWYIFQELLRFILAIRELINLWVIAVALVIALVCIHTIRVSMDRGQQTIAEHCSAGVLGKHQVEETGVCLGKHLTISR